MMIMMMPDVTPNDFWLTAKLKRAPSGKFIEDENELFEEVMKILASISTEGYVCYFDQLLKRMQKCFDKKVITLKRELDVSKGKIIEIQW